MGKRFKAGALIADRYQLVRPLAQGGMGAVWVAFDTRLDRHIAVKTLLAGVRRQHMLTRFEREAKAAAKLRSPHIVEIHDFGIQPAPFIAMELLNGEPLSERMKRGPIEIPDVATILRHVAKALAVAHRAGVVHRDLKPGNIFLADYADRTVFAKVLDFGIAKSDDVKTITAAGAVVGTPRYMSPEQIRCSRSVDRRTDIWALACIAYRLLSGVHAFPGRNPVDVVNGILNAPPTAPSKHNPTLPKEVDIAFRRALTLELDIRHDQAHELVGELLLGLGVSNVGDDSLRGLESHPGRAPLESMYPVPGLHDLPSAAELSPEADITKEAVTVRTMATAAPSSHAATSNTDVTSPTAAPSRSAAPSSPGVTSNTDITKDTAPLDSVTTELPRPVDFRTTTARMPPPSPEEIAVAATHAPVSSTTHPLVDDDRPARRRAGAYVVAGVCTMAAALIGATWWQRGGDFGGRAHTTSNAEASVPDANAAPPEVTTAVPTAIPAEPASSLTASDAAQSSAAEETAPARRGSSSVRPKGIWPSRRRTPPQRSAPSTGPEPSATAAPSTSAPPEGEPKPGKRDLLLFE